MHDFCPEGFLRRHPRHSKIVRTPLTSLGPNDEWSADGHDKLASVGIAIYGFRDKASGYWLSLRVVPNNRLNIVIMYLYLSLIEEKGGESDPPDQFPFVNISFPSKACHSKAQQIAGRKPQVPMLWQTSFGMCLLCQGIVDVS